MKKYLIQWHNPYDYLGYSDTVEADSPEQAIWNLAVETWMTRGQVHNRIILMVSEVTGQ